MYVTGSRMNNINKYIKQTGDSKQQYVKVYRCCCKWPPNLKNRNSDGDHKMIWSSIHWHAGGFYDTCRKKSVTSLTAIQKSLIQKITSSYLPFHREKMGSHLLVETSRNPECPKVSFRRWSDSFSPLVLFWHRPESLRLTLYSGVLQRKLLPLSLSCILLHDQGKGNSP